MTSPDDRPDRSEPDEERAWAELVQVFHASTDDTTERRWPAAEDLDPDDEGVDLYDITSDALTADDILSAPVADDDSNADGGSQSPPDDTSPHDNSTHDRFPRDHDRPNDAGRSDDGDTLTGPRSAPGVEPDPAESEHFVPPHPPPIPRGDVVSRLAWAGIIGAPSVILLAGLLSITLPINVMGFLAIAFVVGFATLVYRMRGRHPSDPDDGAVL